VTTRDHAAAGLLRAVFVGQHWPRTALAVAPNGVVYVHTWSGPLLRQRYATPRRIPVALQGYPCRRPGRVTVRFGETREQAAPAARRALYDGGPLREVNDRIVRYLFADRGDRAERPPE